MVYGFQSGILLSYVWNVISTGKKRVIPIHNYMRTLVVPKESLDKLSVINDSI